jgi:hypothetical protein
MPQLAAGNQTNRNILTSPANQPHRASLFMAHLTGQAATRIYNTYPAETQHALPAIARLAQFIFLIVPGSPA